MISNSFIENVIAAIVVLIVLSLMSYSVWLRRKNTKLANDLVQAIVDKAAIAGRLAKASVPEGKPIEQTDGFIKFLTESRDSAFDYIEKVQTDIVLIKQDLGPIVEAYRNADKQTSDMKQVISSYDKLVSLLPDTD